MLSSRRRALAIACLAASCATQAPTPTATPKREDAMTPETAGSPDSLRRPWTGPHGGVPPFGRFQVRDLRTALDAAMAENLAEADQIASRTDAPTFENTIVTMERMGETLDRVNAVYGIYTSTMNDPEVQAIEREMSPKLAALGDRIVQNSRLFARIENVYAQRDSLGL